MIAVSGWVTEETLRETEDLCWTVVGKDPVARQLKKMGFKVSVPYGDELEDMSPWMDYCLNKTRYRLNTVAADLMFDAYRFNKQGEVRPFWFRLVKL